MGLVRRVDPDGVRVAAGVTGCLEQRDLVPVLKQVRHDQSGDAGADDRHSHRRLTRSMWMIRIASADGSPVDDSRQRDARERRAAADRHRGRGRSRWQPTAAHRGREHVGQIAGGAGGEPGPEWPAASRREQRPGVEDCLSRTESAKRDLNRRVLGGRTEPPKGESPWSDDQRDAVGDAERDD
jgi:hypothetical protein